MRPHPNASQAEAFIDTAIQISDAVEGGASPNDPAVVDLLRSVTTRFGVTPLVGGQGSDHLLARAAVLTYTNGLGGNDIIFGRGGVDVIVGGSGNDQLLGGGGNDALFGGSGNDFLFGGTGNDALRGGTGNDQLFGGFGNDQLLGGADNDILIAGKGNDLLRGGTGNDHLFGETGNDMLEGGSGNDLLAGGQGHDVFVFNPANRTEGADRIADFTLGRDTIQLKVADILAATPDIGGDITRIDQSQLWDLRASADGSLLVIHPGGTIEVDGVAFDASFTILGLVEAGAVEVI